MARSFSPLIGIILLLLLRFGEKTFVFCEEDNHFDSEEYSEYTTVNSEERGSETDSDWVSSHASVGSDKFPWVTATMRNLRNVTAQIVDTLKKSMEDLQNAQSMLELEIQEAFKKNCASAECEENSDEIKSQIGTWRRSHPPDNGEFSFPTPQKLWELKTVNSMQEYNSANTRICSDTADEILRQNWDEVMRNWDLLETRRTNDDAIPIYQRAVIRLVISASHPKTRPATLNSIFTFMHKLSMKGYKVSVYTTLVDQLLDPKNSDIFDGSEVFALAHFVYHNYVTYSKDFSAIPWVAKTIGSTADVRLLYLPLNRTEVVEPETNEEPTHNSRSSSEVSQTLRKRKVGVNRKKGSKVKLLEQRRQRQRQKVANSLEVHPNRPLNVASDYIWTFASDSVVGTSHGERNQQNSTTFWSFTLECNGFFKVRSKVNSKCLFVPGLSANVTTIRSGDPLASEDGVFWKPIYVGDETFRIESKAYPGKFLHSVPWSRVDSAMTATKIKQNSLQPLAAFQIGGNPDENVKDGKNGLFTLGEYYIYPTN